jgi:serine/threonine protein phosphatase PrpC
MTIQSVIQGEGLTDVGRVRSANQDAYLADSDLGLFIVADGMGGHAGGEIASSLCVQEVQNYLRAARDTFQDLSTHPDAKLANALGHAINHASTKIYERALEEPTLKGMGTTATVLQIVNGHAYIGHVGDSRCYLIRCGLIYQMTNDHSLVSEQVRAGIITKEEAESHHLRNVITRSVGYQEEEDVDTLSLKLEDGDFFILCSDGLHGKVSDREISQLTREHDLKAAQPLIGLANARGGDDNITVVIVKIGILSQ